MLTQTEMHLFLGILIVVAICTLGLCVFLSSTQTKIVPHMKGHLCPDWTGRLGNHMFQYASLFGIAKRNDMILTIHKDDEITSVIDNLFALKLQNNSVCENAQTWGEKEPCLYDKLAATVPSNRNVKHMSLLQSWNYFSHVEQAIREQFTFNQKVESKCQKMLKDAIIGFTSNKTDKSVEKLQVVGIHIRRGDYLDKDKIAYGYQTADEEYINKSMNYFRSKFKHVLFLAYTSYYWKDLLWREKHVGGSDVVRMRVTSPEVDMCVLSKCNHSIITVGSFGWWAAWLANGTTIYFKNAAKDNSEYRNDFSEDMTDYFYPGWIGF
ncbi:galactoside alpha-(1,2)-fucosyltransferase 2-like [Mytilus galloprovincialis]|uniref:galactoside alpha-(1,2)-fucosyltransferase 2-like n=1 Tax=Mytilus galloprovincialis TaxID=29158 RepID=UPI003F7C17B5